MYQIDNQMYAFFMLLHLDFIFLKFKHNSNSHLGISLWIDTLIEIVAPQKKQKNKKNTLLQSFLPQNA